MFGLSWARRETLAIETCVNTDTSIAANVFLTVQAKSKQASL
jgi:hypothetical protein